MVAAFSLIIVVPWLNVANGTLASFRPLDTVVPTISLLSLNLLGKMGFGAFAGFEYVAIHAGECRDPVKSITRATAIAAPLIIAHDSQRDDADEDNVAGDRSTENA